MTPRVSVVMATHDHAPYVAQAIRSVLDQTFRDFEFLIVDDGSRDDTPRVVGQFDDPRLVFRASAENRGSAARRNELVAASRGEYVAVQNSDDYWTLDKLARQVEFLDAHPEYAATFGGASFVDADGAPLWRDVPSPFAQANRSRAAWLRHFFAGENGLCHPSVMMRRTCAEEIGGYDIRLRQRLDLDMWTRLVKRRSLYVTSDVLVFLRWHGKNISNTNPVDAHSRWLNEHFLMAESFFDGVSKGLFVEAFGDLLVHADPPAEEYCDIEKALLHLRCRSSVGALNAVVGLRRLHELLGSPRHRAILAGDYGIDHVVFHRLSGETGTFHQALQPPAGGEVGGRLIELERTAAERGARLDALLASRSWRVLAPLRLAGRLIASRWRRGGP